MNAAFSKYTRRNVVCSSSDEQRWERQWQKCVKGSDTELVAAPEYDTNEREVNNNKLCTANAQPIEDTLNVEKCDTVADCDEDKEKE